METGTMHESMDKFIKSLELEGQISTAKGYQFSLSKYDGFCRMKGIDPLRVTTETVRLFASYLSEVRSSKGIPLATSTQATRLSAVKAWYEWMAKRRMILADPAKGIELPKVPKGVTLKDYLSLQEATALLQTQAARMERSKPNTLTWARECRNLALIAIALATGKRRSSIRNLKVSDMDFRRNEVRVEKEKGKSGAVFPCARWAMALAKEYVEKARPILLRGAADSGWLFLAWRGSRKIGSERFSGILESLVAETIEANPDLEELPTKNITPHSLRVSFATLLFQNGCNIRSINELMLHEKLSTTARYTPIPLEDLRRACRMAHPRA